MREITLVGAPFNIGYRLETSHAVDTHHAPAHIRAAYQELLSGFSVACPFKDLGDLHCSSSETEEVLRVVQSRIQDLLGAGITPAVLGGSHTITLGSLRALNAVDPNYTLVYFDAHPDMMPHPEINYGSSLHFAIAEGVLDPKRVVLIGLRQVEDPEWDYINEHRIAHFNPTDVWELGVHSIIESISKHAPPPYYLSIDLDCLDLAYAPGVSTPYPIGLSPRELISFARAFCRRGVNGFEIVEFSSSNDRNKQTVQIAAALIHEIAQLLREQ